MDIKYSKRNQEQVLGKKKKKKKKRKKKRKEKRKRKEENKVVLSKRKCIFILAGSVFSFFFSPNKSY